MRALGWLPDHRDDRDYDLSALLQKLQLDEPPPYGSVKSYVARVLDQLTLGSCVAFAVGQAIRISHVKQYVDAGMPINLALESSELASMLWFYYWGRAQEHLTKVDSGTRVRLVLNGAIMLGFPTERHWPYSDRKVDREGDVAPFRRMPPKSAFRAAKDQSELVEYHRIYAGGDELERQAKLAISARYAVVGGLDVNWDFVEGNFDPTTPIDPPSTDIAGGHALCIVDYDESGYTIVNSWGEDWGDHGYFKASREFVRSMRDLTVVESAPMYSE